jgi:hypothetical protein
MSDEKIPRASLIDIAKCPLSVRHELIALQQENADLRAERDSLILDRDDARAVAAIRGIGRDDLRKKAALADELAQHLRYWLGAGWASTTLGQTSHAVLERLAALTPAATPEKPPAGLTPEEEIAWAESLPNAANSAYTQEMTEAYTRAQFESATPEETEANGSL